MRKIPRPFKMPWGKGMVIDEVSISSQYHEPTIQLLEFDMATNYYDSVLIRMDGSVDHR